MYTPIPSLSFRDDCRAAMFWKAVKRNMKPRLTTTTFFHILISSFLLHSFSETCSNGEWSEFSRTFSVEFLEVIMFISTNDRGESKSLY